MDGGTLGAALFLFGSLFSAAAGALLGGPGARSRIRWGVTGLILPFVVFFLLYRRARRGTVDTPQGRERPAPEPMPDLAGEDLSGLREPVTACPECGFLGVRPPGIGDGVWAGGGELIGVVCRRCDYRGIPLLFPTREEYVAFVRELKARPAP